MWTAWRGCLETVEGFGVSLKDIIMNTRAGILTTIALIGVGLLLWQASVVAPAFAGGDDDIAFVGSSKCKACHKVQYKSWQEGRKSKSMDTLLPGKFAEVKTKHGLDPQKDYTKDESCLKCHTTGYGAEGGYAIPDAADEKAVKKAKKLEGVGCECCHGPGSKYKKLHKEIKKGKEDGRTYKLEEMYAAGMWKIEAEKCTKCHNDKSPTFKGFDFEKQKSDSSHEHVPLEQRAG
jgi:hypothetical protein